MLKCFSTPKQEFTKLSRDFINPFTVSVNLYTLSVIANTVSRISIIILSVLLSCSTTEAIYSVAIPSLRIGLYCSGVWVIAIISHAS